REWRGYFFFSSRRRHTRSLRDWSSDVCSSDLDPRDGQPAATDRANDLGEEGPQGKDRGEHLVSPGDALVPEGLFDPLGGQHVGEIGRASCRERVESAGVGAYVDKRSGERGGES